MAGRLALAAPHSLATEAGAAAFRAGGNAFDAALAAAATLAVVAPQDCSIGGDAIALVREPRRAPRVVNGSGAAARDVDVDALRTRHRAMPVRGVDPITVPGAVGAWEAIHALGARLAWPDLLEAAVAHAGDGVAVSAPLARALGRWSAFLADDAGLRAVLMPGGEPLGAGGVLRQPALARTLRAIAAGGAAELYRGSVGERLVGGLGALGAPLRRSDLEAHSTELTVPLRRPFADLDIATAPPNSQGFVLLELLGALAAAGDVPDPLGEHLDLLARLCRLAARDRDRYLADPRWCDVPAELLVDPRYTAALLAMARNGASEPPALPVAGAGGGDPAAGPGGGDPAAGDTVAVVALDDEGYAVSLIQSVFWSFGAGVLEPATGILLHNRGAGFSLDPAAAGVLRGGARPPHTLMPVLALRGDDVAGAHGTRGGQAQPQIHLQVLLRLLRGASATEAVAAPRWIVGEDDRVRIERDADEAGHAQVVRRTATGELEAGTDPRAGGAGIVVER